MSMTPKAATYALYALAVIILGALVGAFCWVFFFLMDRTVFVGFAGALLPLLFGASIGPEAGLTDVIAGACTWVGDRLKFLGRGFRELASVGIAAVAGAMFSAPLYGLAVPVLGDGEVHESVADAGKPAPRN